MSAVSGLNEMQSGSPVSDPFIGKYRFTSSIMNVVYRRRSAILKESILLVRYH